MKYLQDYIEDKQSQLFNDLGAFWAFNNQQFDESKKANTKYSNIGCGLVCPTKNAEKLIEGLEAISKEGRKQDLEENGKKEIIKRELYNYECFVSWDLEIVVNSLKAYSISEEEITEVFHAEVEKREN